MRGVKGGSAEILMPWLPWSHPKGIAFRQSLKRTVMTNIALP
jgi:hypothetical protein